MGYSKVLKLGMNIIMSTEITSSIFDGIVGEADKLLFHAPKSYLCFSQLITNSLCIMTDAFFHATFATLKS